MSIADVHARATRFQDRIRFRNITEYVASAVVIAVFAWMAFVMPEPFVRLGAAMIALAAVYVCWRLFGLARAAKASEVAHTANWVAFHRAELVRQRDALRGVWRWYLGPFIPGMIVFLAGVAFAPSNGLPLAARLSVLALSLAVVLPLFWLVSALNAKAAKAMQREIDALDRMQ